MARFYVDGNSARFTRKDICLVDMELFGGEIVEDLEPRRLFPVSGRMKYITLLDSEGKEHAIIRDVETLSPESKEVILECLREYYLIPKITGLLERTEKFGILKWTVQTDRGVQQLRIRNRNSDIKQLYDGRSLVRDSNDNRYEIIDYRKLDKNSLKLLSADI
ncbi:MAG: DUF1854 domain-containing protein [Clostridia bacterium]|nr:DUF1854 domain-containing protein [Clostridia bacterium]